MNKYNLRKHNGPEVLRIGRDSLGREQGFVTELEKFLHESWVRLHDKPDIITRLLAWDVCHTVSLKDWEHIIHLELANMDDLKYCYLCLVKGPEVSEAVNKYYKFWTEQ